MTSEAVDPGLPAANSCARTHRCGPYLVVEVFGEVDIATEELVAEHLLAATAPRASSPTGGSGPPGTT
ncbi:hypothetical protein ABZ372_34805, partial [Streptomyces sp. NPDC005921]